MPSERCDPGRVLVELAARATPLPQGSCSDAASNVHCRVLKTRAHSGAVSSVQQSQEHTQAPSCEHATCCLRSSFHICKSSPKYTKSATGSANTLLPRCTCTPADFSVGLHHLVTPSLHQRHRGCHQQPKGTSQHRRTPKLPPATVSAGKPVGVCTLLIPVGISGY